MPKKNLPVNLNPGNLAISWFECVLWLVIPVVFPQGGGSAVCIPAFTCNQPEDMMYHISPARKVSLPLAALYFARCTLLSGGGTGLAGAGAGSSSEEV